MPDLLKRLRKSSDGTGPPEKASAAEPARTKVRPRERGQMRRRLRQQQRVREALLLDLGALVYELHRQGRRKPELLQAKAAELSAVDGEVRALADALDVGDSIFELVAAGIAGSCESCGQLLTVDARFCPACGVPTAPALTAEHAPSDEVPPALDFAANGPGERGLEEREEQDEIGTDEHAALGAGEPEQPDEPEQETRQSGRPPWADPEPGAPADGGAPEAPPRQPGAVRRLARRWLGSRSSRSDG